MEGRDKALYFLVSLQAQYLQLCAGNNWGIHHICIAIISSQPQTSHTTSGLCNTILFSIGAATTVILSSHISFKVVHTKTHRARLLCFHLRQCHSWGCRLPKIDISICKKPIQSLTVNLHSDTTECFRVIDRLIVFTTVLLPSRPSVN